VIGRGVRALMALLTVSFAAPLGAQSDNAWSGQFRLYGAYGENFFQSSDPDEERDVWSGTVSGRIERRLGSGPLRLFVGGEYTYYDFDPIDPTPGVIGGLRLDSKGHTLSLSAAHAWKRPRFDTGETVAQADVLSFSGLYSYRFRFGLELTALGDYDDEDFLPENVPDGYIYEAGAAIGWRHPRRLFSPEVGVLTGARKTDSDSENYDEEQIYGRIRSSPVPALYISLRYRHRERDYTVTRTTSRNFGRRDRRRDFSAAFEISLTPEFVLTLYYAHLDARSTRANRDFETDTFGAGLIVKF
jgi:hypothetical protein